MKTLHPGYAAHIATGCTTLAWCWKVERKDGVIMGFTDHDLPLTFEGVTYEAASGFSASAIEDQLGLATANLDVAGALRSDALTEDDLNAGRYDDAEVTIIRVNWADPSQREVFRRGWLGQTTRGQVAFTAEMRGLASRLDQIVGRTFTRTCPWKLGDARCGIDLAEPARRGLGEVLAVLDGLAFMASGLETFPSGHFALGRLEWTSGPSTGLAVDVSAHSLSGADARVQLMLPIGAPVQVGDAFIITEGCDNTFSTCALKANAVNFGGFPHIPGNDFAVTYASSGDVNDGGRLSGPGHLAATT